MAWLPLAAVLLGTGWGANQVTPMLLVYRQTLGLSTRTLEAVLGIYALRLTPGLMLAGPRPADHGPLRGGSAVRRALPGRGEQRCRVRRRHGVAARGVAAPVRHGQRSHRRAQGRDRDDERFRAGAAGRGAAGAVGSGADGGAVPAPHRGDGRGAGRAARCTGDGARRRAAGAAPDAARAA